MLRMFASEDGELLVSHFGRPDLHRSIDNLNRALESSPRGYLRVGERWIGVSLVGFWLVCYAAIFMLAAAVMQLVAKHTREHGLWWITVAAVVFFLLLAVRYHSYVERSLLFAAGGGGALLAAVMIAI
jgi:hypothetical protein